MLRSLFVRPSASLGLLCLLTGRHLSRHRDRLWPNCFSPGRQTAARLVSVWPVPWAARSSARASTARVLPSPAFGGGSPMTLQLRVELTGAHRPEARRHPDRGAPRKGDAGVTARSRGHIPADMVTASGSGLDPEDLSRPTPSSRLPGWPGPQDSAPTRGQLLRPVHRRTPAGLPGRAASKRPHCSIWRSTALAQR